MTSNYDSDDQTPKKVRYSNEHVYKTLVYPTMWSLLAMVGLVMMVLIAVFDLHKVGGDIHIPIAIIGFMVYFGGIWNIIARMTIDIMHLHEWWGIYFWKFGVRIYPGTIFFAVGLLTLAAVHAIVIISLKIF